MRNLQSNLDSSIQEFFTLISLAILLVCIIKSMMENVIRSMSMKSAIMMELTVVQMLLKLVIASATLKMTSGPVTMMVEIAV